MGAGNDFPASPRYLRQMLRVPLHVWIAAAVVAFGFLNIPINDGSAVPRLIGTASVIDGDTLEIHGQRIRLHALDAPEKGQSCTRDGKVWRCGKASAMALSDKIGRSPVRCVERDIDRYQRVIAVCYLGNEDLGGWLVGQGLAVADARYGKAYMSVEVDARRAGRGIWAGEFVIPWDWRKGVR